jgi:hypothetical protein
MPCPTVKYEKAAECTFPKRIRSSGFATSQIRSAANLHFRSLLFLPHRESGRYSPYSCCQSRERPCNGGPGNARQPHGNAPVYVNTSIADAVMAALHAADPRRRVIYHPIVRPSVEVAGRPGPRLARGDAYWSAGTSVEDAAGEGAGAHRAAE